MSVLIHLDERVSKKRLIEQSPSRGDLVYLVNRTPKNREGSQPSLLTKFLSFQEGDSSFWAGWALVLVLNENSLREDRIGIPYSPGVEKDGERQVLYCDAYTGKEEILKAMESHPQTKPYASWFRHFL